MDVLYGIRILAADYFVLSQCTHLTEDCKTMHLHSQSHSTQETHQEMR